MEIQSQTRSLICDSAMKAMFATAESNIFIFMMSIYSLIPVTQTVKIRLGRSRKREQVFNYLLFFLPSI